MPFQPITAPAASEPLGLALAEGAGITVNPDDALDPAGNWKRGYTLVGDVCVPSRYLLNPRQCDDEGTPLEDLPDTELFPGPEAQGGAGFPFVIGSGIACGTFTGEKELDSWKGQARRHLELAQWADIANELWTGGKAVTEGWPNRYLASPDADILVGTTETPTAVGVVDALAQTDAFFSGCMIGGPRLIHVSRRFLQHAKAKGALERIGNRYYTPNGSLLVTDDGYPGTGPDLAGAGPGDPPEPRDAPGANETWIYGTGPILVRMTPIEFPQEDDWANYVDTKTNFITAIAHRWVMVSWQCCQLAALVNLAA
jgi:hypothetical protein